MTSAQQQPALSADICIGDGSSCTPMAFAPICWPCRMSGKRRWQASSSSSRPRAHPKPSPTFAASARAERAALTQSVDAMAAEGLRVLGVAQRLDRRSAGRNRSDEFAFEFSGLSALPIRCGPACPRRWPNAARPASGSS